MPSGCSSLVASKGKNEKAVDVKESMRETDDDVSNGIFNTYQRRTRQKMCALTAGYIGAAY